MTPHPLEVARCGCTGRVRCSHFAGWVVTLSYAGGGAFMLSGGHDADDVEPDYTMLYGDEASAVAAFDEAAEGLRMLYDAEALQ